MSYEPAEDFAVSLTTLVQREEERALIVTVHPYIGAYSEPELVARGWNLVRENGLQRLVVNVSHPIRLSMRRASPPLMDEAPPRTGSSHEKN